VNGLEQAVGDALGDEVVTAHEVPGGDLGDAQRMELRGGDVVFVKTYAGVVEGVHATEAAGLRWLAHAEGGPAVPEVLAVADGKPGAIRFLALRWIEAGPPSSLDEEALGRELAAMHRAGAPSHGGAGTLHLGQLSLSDGPTDDWAQCYAEQRVRPLIGRAVEHRELTRDDAADIERVCDRMAELAGPDEPPARLHGDLWAGNVLAGSDGRPWLVDPAAHGGHREVDLAMLRLFGGPGQRCFSAYEEVAPLADGWRDRVALWQLFPLLVHAVLFGGTYGGRAGEVARRYL
jgi:fructosamine-3-kinase